jgi:hypothetical protein
MPNNLPTAGPWGTRSEYLVDQALDNALEATPDELRAMRPVAAPQQAFPRRTGFQANQWTIEQVLNIDRLTPTYRSWTSGMPAQTSIMSDQAWGGSARNALSEGTF